MSNSLQRVVIGISPIVDFAFKLMFGSPEHTSVTIHFLNSVLRLQVPIKSITIENPFVGKNAEDDNLSILDILATDEFDRIFNIEMQTTLPLGINQRFAFHGARLYGGQLRKGEDYSSLNPAIVVCVLTEPMFPDADLHLDFQLRDESGRVLTDDMQIHLLQLSKLKVAAQNVRDANHEEQWAYFLLNVDKLSMEEIRQFFPDAAFQEAAGVLEMIAQTPELRTQYDARLKFQMDDASRLLRARSEGKAEGIEIGEQRGKVIGQIILLQEMLGIESPSSDELSRWNEVQLVDLANDLKRRHQNRDQ